MEGSAGFPQLRPVSPTPAAELRAPWRQRAAYPGMQVSFWGQGTAWALSRREGASGPQEGPRGSPRPGGGAPVASPGSCHGAWPCSPWPRFAAGECLSGTPSVIGKLFVHR